MACSCSTIPKAGRSRKKNQKHASMKPLIGLRSSQHHPGFFFKSMITHDKGERTYLPPIAKLNILQTGLIASLIKGSSWLLSASGCKMAVPV
jgi:hypothetical protein